MDYTALVNLTDKAIAGNETLVLTYRDSNGNGTRREIRPIELNGAYLRAYCYLRQAERSFRLDRIALCEPIVPSSPAAVEPGEMGYPETIQDRLTSTRKPERRLRSTRKLEYHSDFYALDSQWSEADKDAAKWFRRDGYYYLGVRQPNYSAWSGLLLAKQSFEVLVDAQFPSNGPDRAQCGIVFGFCQWPDLSQDHYSFRITRHGYYAVLAFVEGVSETVQDWRYTEAISRGDGLNCLRVSMVDRRLEVGVNGQTLSSGTFAEPTGGTVGVTVGASVTDPHAQARFRDFRLYSLPSSEEEDDLEDEGAEMAYRASRDS